MKEPVKDDNLEMPGDPGNESGHSEGYYEAHSEMDMPEVPEDMQEPQNHEPSPLNEADSDAGNDDTVKRLVRRKTLRDFSIFGILTLLVLLGFRAIILSPDDQGIYHTLRSVLNFNEKVNKPFFKETHLAPQYPFSAAVPKPKVNGDYGMGTDFDTSEWLLNVVNIDKNDTMHLTMQDIRKLPKTEICFNFKCIEGWSQVTHWGGVRFIDFIHYYKLATHSGKPIDENNLADLANYAGFETPDDEYYVGLDIASALHPQTLLCYEMNGKPLPYNQGAPLRLIVPVKYGIKSLKRIGVIFFSDSRPHDYWFEQGYDYDAAL